jgi:hypothetical protein
MNKIQKRRTRNALMLIPLFIVFVTAGIYFFAPDFQEYIYVPKEPVEVPITKEKTANMAAGEAIARAAEATKITCNWSEEKRQSGAYDAFATMTVWRNGNSYFAQVKVDKSVCPDTK